MPLFLLKSLLETAEEEVPELIPFLAMAGFAGLRRSELVREYAEDQVLRWEDISWQKRLITIRHEVAKQTSRKMGNRRFIPMEAALLHWLGPYRKKQGLLVPLVDSAVRRRMKKLCLHSKVNRPTMLFVIRMLRIGWRVQAKRDWANSPNEWAILKPSANGTTWKRSLERKVWPGSKFGVLSEPVSVVSAAGALSRP